MNLDDYISRVNSLDNYISKVNSLDNYISRVNSLRNNCARPLLYDNESDQFFRKEVNDALKRFNDISREIGSGRFKPINKEYSKDTKKYLDSFIKSSNESKQSVNKMPKVTLINIKEDGLSGLRNLVGSKITYLYLDNSDHICINVEYVNMINGTVACEYIMKNYVERIVVVQTENLLDIQNVFEVASQILRS